MTRGASCDASSGHTRCLRHATIGSIKHNRIASIRSTAHGIKAGSIAVDHRWCRATPGGAGVTADELTLKNQLQVERIGASECGHSHKSH